MSSRGGVDVHSPTRSLGIARVPAQRGPSEPVAVEGVTMARPVDSTNEQIYASSLADAVCVFTATARLRGSVSGGVGDEHAEPVDWAEFVTLALAGAAANIGHIEAVLAGRPGHGRPKGSASC